MNTYYDIRLTPEQRRTLIELANMGLIEWCNTWEKAPDDPRRTAYEQAVALLEDAEEHPISTETAPKYDLLEKHKEAWEYLRARGIEPYITENGIKNIDTAPKYDPNRKFKKGDRVRIVEYKGRIGTSAHSAGDIVTVDRDEEDCEWVFLKVDDEDRLDVIDPAYLELVIPVEELKPYFIMELKGAYGVYNTRFQPEAEVCHYFNDMHPHAKEAAEAERDRLNAEYRKERENG